MDWAGQLCIGLERIVLLDLPIPADKIPGRYRQIQQDYSLKPYVTIDRPNPFVNQVRYRSKHAEAIFFINSNMEQGYALELAFSPEIVAGKWPWLWDVVTGERYRLELSGGAELKLVLGPADSKLIVFDKKKKGPLYAAQPAGEGQRLTGWSVEWRHIDGSNMWSEMDELKDLKDTPAHVSFSGIIIYRKTITLESDKFLDLGKVFGVSELSVNGVVEGVQWYGRRVFRLEKGENSLEIKITAAMGNYLKTLTQNPVAQYWTNAGRKDQPIQSMGMVGPVIIYQPFI